MAVNHESLPCIPRRVKGKGSPEQVASRSCPLRDAVGLGRQWVASKCPWDVDVSTLALLSLAVGNLTTQQRSCWEGSDICFKFFTRWDTFYNTQRFCKEQDELMCLRRTFYICALKRHPPFPNKHVLHLLLFYIVPFI